MHLQPPLHCPRCERTFDRIVRCPDCDVAPVDARGRAARIAPRSGSHVDRGDTLTLVSSGLVMLGAAATIPLPFVGSALMLAGAAGLVAASRRPERGPRDAPDAHTALAVMQRPISIRSAIDRRGGVVTVRGELVAVPSERRVGGVAPRFGVTDGTGVALVDDDSLSLWATDASGPTVQTFDLPPRARVRVMGRARVATSDEERLVWHGDDVGYRGARSVLSFDGDAASPTIAFLEPPGDAAR